MKTHRQAAERGSIVLVMMLILALSVGLMALASYVQVSSRIEAQAEAQIKAQFAAEAALEKNMAELYTKANEVRPNKLSLEDVTTAVNLGTVPSTLFPAAQGYSYTTNIAVPLANGVPASALPTTGPMNYRFVSQVSATFQPPNGGPGATATMQREYIQRIFPLFQFAIFYDGDGELNPGAAFTVEGRVHCNGIFYYGSGATLTFQGLVTDTDNAGGNRRLVPQNGPHPQDPHGGSYGTAPVYTSDTPFWAPLFDFPCRVPNATYPNNATGPREYIELPVAGETDPNNRERMYSRAGVKVILYTATSGSGTFGAETIGARNLSVETLGDLSVAQEAAAEPGFRLFTLDGTLVPLRAGNRITTLYKQFDRILAIRRPAPSQAQVQVISDCRQSGDNSNGYRFRVTAVNIGELKAAVDGAPTPTFGRILTRDVNGNNFVPSEAQYGAAQGKAFWNGILYFADLSSLQIGATEDLSANNRNHRCAIVLWNGANALPTTTHPVDAKGGGLTVGTDLPAYTIGDYNTGAVGAAVPSNNSGGGASRVAGYSVTVGTEPQPVRPAAIIADAITILSRKWSETFAAGGLRIDLGSSVGYNNQPLGSRNPVWTTLNTAFIAGNVPTTSAAYSGGAENYPRLLENWGGQLTLYTSIICLYPSRWADRRWRQTGNYYNAATRNWHFETMFLNPDFLPPGTPSAITFSRAEWVRF